MHTLTKLRIGSAALFVGGFAAAQLHGGSDLWLALCITTGGLGFAACLFAFTLDHSDFGQWSVVKQTRHGTSQWVVGRLEADVWVECGRFSTKNAAQRFAFEVGQQEVAQLRADESQRHFLRARRSPASTGNRIAS